MTAKRLRQKPICILGDDEVEALQAACSRGLTGYRNRALIALLRGAALRCDEALELWSADLDLRHSLVQVRRGKGAKERTVGMSPSAVAAVELWMHKRIAAPFATFSGRTLFCSRSGAKLDDSYVRALLRRLARVAGIDKRVHPHGLRHSAAVAMRRRGVDIEKVQAQLGHSSLAATQVYVNHLAPDDLAAAMAQAEQP